MEVPKEILVVPLKEKKPLIQNKKRALQILMALISTSGFFLYLIYYPAPLQFSFTNAPEIATMCMLVFLSSCCIGYLFFPFKKALVIATLITANLALKKSPIITIIAYAICLPLLFLKPLQEQPR